MTELPGLTLHSPLGLIAGNGQLPIDFARAAKERGLEVVAVGIRDEADETLAGDVREFVWVKIGQLSRVIKTFKQHGVTQVAFAGGIRRTRLFGAIAFDWRALALLARVRSVKDDELLRGIAEELEREGCHVISVSTVLEKSVPRAGLHTRRALSDREIEDALIGWEAAEAVGSVDIGQTVIAFGGIVVAVEAVEGTDQAIARAGELTRLKDHGSSGPVVVKLCKPKQDTRLDLPTIGEHTIESMRKAQATALVLHAGKCLILDPEKVIKMADEAKISIIAAENSDQLARALTG